MKTEKRLTMALSVLVALMMLAVPLASSSNLFVDGGQTNSNGDAPVLGAAGDTLTINLNIPENSLDGIDYEALSTKLNATYADLYNTTNKVLGTDNTKDMVYSVSEAGVITAVCIDQTAEITIAAVQDAVVQALKLDDVNKGLRMKAYTPSFSGVSNKGALISGQTLDASWKLNSDEYAEININTSGLGNDSVLVKTYKYVAGSNKAEITIDTLPIDKDAGNGYVVNINNNTTPISVYTKKITAGSIDLTNATSQNIPVGDITVEYTFNSDDYRAISVESNIFEEPIVLYAAKTTTDVTELATHTYAQIYTLLKSVPAGSAYVNVDGDNIATDKSYEVFNWTDKKDSENYALDSNSPAGYDLILNANFTTFSVVFMVKGQVQVVDVKYGDFSEASCPFDVTGIVAWMKLVSIDETSGAPTVESFSFDVASEDLQKELLPSESAINPLTLIAVFSDPTETSYVTFNADEGYFGDKEDKITQIVVPVANGTTANNIPQPVNPTPNAESSFFAFWTETVETDKSEYKFTSSSAIEKDTVLTAEYIDYKYSVTLNVNGNEYMVVYLKDVVTAGNSIVGEDVVGVKFNSNVYTTTNIGSVSSVANYSLGNFIMENIIPSVSGYDFIQYNDEDGNKALEITISASGEDKGKVTGVTSISKIGANVEFNATFEAADYVIIYSGNTAAATNSMLQVGTVGESLNFYSDSTFSNDGYKLKEWNTRPDGNGTTYSLGSAFTLSGEDYAKLSKVSNDISTQTGIDYGFTLYAIWEKVGTSDVPGDNTDGGNDSNTDTYLLAGILVVIIVLIVLLAFLLRKKN